MEIINILKYNIRSIYKYWFKCIGVLASILTVLFLFISWEDIKIETLSQKFMLLIVSCLLLLFWTVLWICIIRKRKIIWQYSSGRIIVCYADLLNEAFKEKNKKEQLYVIPVNSSFDTVVDSDISLTSKPLVSPRSLHGKWIKKMEETGKNLADIDSEINHSLKIHNIKPIKILTDTQKVRGKKEIYELGTVAIVKGKRNNIFLLLALTNFDDNNNAHTSMEELEFALKKLIEFYDQYGQGYEMMMPLMGTNLSRAHISHEEALRIITSKLLLHKKHICGDISIAIYPGDKDKVTIDI